MSMVIQAPTNAVPGALVLCRIYDDVKDNTMELTLGIIPDGRIAVLMEDRDAGTMTKQLNVRAEDIDAALRVLIASDAGGLCVMEDGTAERPAHRTATGDPRAIALAVPGVKQVSLHRQDSNPWKGTVYSDEVGTEFDVRETADGLWNVNDDEGRNFTDVSLDGALRKAIASNETRA